MQLAIIEPIHPKVHGQYDNDIYNNWLIIHCFTLDEFYNDINNIHSIIEWRKSHLRNDYHKYYNNHPNIRNYNNIYGYKI